MSLLPGRSPELSEPDRWLGLVIGLRRLQDYDYVMRQLITSEQISELPWDSTIGAKANQ